MKFESILTIGALGVILYLFKDNIMGLFDGGSATPQDPGAPTAIKYSSDWFVQNQYYDNGVWQPYNTTIPVTTTEPGVSAGIPIGYSGVIPIGTTIPLQRFPGDTDVITQCPGGNLQGGSPSSMSYLLTSTDAAAVAWRARYCT